VNYHAGSKAVETNTIPADVNQRTHEIEKQGNMESKHASSNHTITHNVENNHLVCSDEENDDSSHASEFVDATQLINVDSEDQGSSQA